MSIVQGLPFLFCCILLNSFFFLQNILAEGDISVSVRRASSEGLGLLSRLGSDTFTARMVSFIFVCAIT